MIADTHFLLGDIDAHWERIAPRLKYVDGEGAGFAREECRAGRAVCLATEEGIVVFNIEKTPDVTRLFVILAASTGAVGAFQRHEAAVCKIAKDIGAAEIAFKASRRGWEKLLGAEWVEREGLFSRSVEP